MPSPSGTSSGAASKRTSTSSTTTRSASRRASSRVSYVTGSHSIKVGFENRWANAIQANAYNGDVAILFTLNNAPYLAHGHQRAVAEQDAVQLGRRRVRPGSVAARATSRSTWAPATTSSTRSSRRSRCPTRTSCKGYSIRQDLQHAQLERLGDPDRRGLGRVRQRQDGRQGLRGPLHRGRGVLAHLAVQPDLQPHRIRGCGPT